MRKSEFEPTENELRAAWEFLRRNNSSIEVESWSKAAEMLKFKYQQWGRDDFHLKFGLRAPTTAAEQHWFDLFWGRISEDEFRERMRDYGKRPVDSEMVRGFYDYVETQVELYSRFVTEVTSLVESPRRQPVLSADEDGADKLAEAMKFRSKLLKQELMSVSHFVEEARVAKQMGLAKLGEFTAPTASELVLRHL